MSDDVVESNDVEVVVARAHPPSRSAAVAFRGSSANVNGEKD
jgi:hypothetical protein